MKLILKLIHQNTEFKLSLGSISLCFPALKHFLSQIQDLHISLSKSLGC